MLAYYDYKGMLKPAPKDYDILFSNPDKSIVLSRKGRIYRVRYCLQVNEFCSLEKALEYISGCILHNAENNLT